MEIPLSKGELYTIVSNDDKRCGKGSIVAVIKGAKGDEVFICTQKDI